MNLQGMVFLNGLKWSKSINIMPVHEARICGTDGSICSRISKMTRIVYLTHLSNQNTKIIFSDYPNNDGGSAKKCRAVYGLEAQHLWCAPCR